jgi:hypothetical protein
VTSLGIGIGAIALLFSPIAEWIGMTMLTLPVMVTLTSITMLYIVATEIAKRLVYRSA